ncbi:MAG TPA: ice-binding family protein [bacterium]|nr:ice-binding family protein [bacterium]
MKKLLGLMFVTVFSTVLWIGCGSKNTTPSGPTGPTVTPTNTVTPTGTITPGTPTGTPTATATQTATNTPTVTGTITPVITATPQAAQTPVNLGSTVPFAVLAFSDETNTGATTLCGDLGLWSGTAFGAGYVFCNAGVTHITDGTAQTAQGDLTTAITDASGRSNAALVSGDLGGLTLYPGLYKSSGTLAITGNLTLDAQSNPNAVFIFQVADTFATAVSSQVVLAHGADAANIYWQIGTNCSLGNYSTFMGTIMTGTATTIGTGVVLNGRALAKSAVTMQGDDIAVPTP